MNLWKFRSLKLSKRRAADVTASAARRAAASRAAACRLERLEDRTLFAAVLQPGFSYTTAYTFPIKESTAMEFAPGNRLFFAEKGGNLRVFVNGVLKSEPVMSLRVDGYAERGFDGFTIDPNFATNGFVYCFYSRQDPNKPNQPDSNAKNRLSKFKINLATNKRDTNFPEQILIDNLDADTGFHNGGALHFGTDGKLYVAVGEAGPPSATGVSPASDLNSLSGKLLRINSDGSVPADNPYVGQAGKRPEIWAYGFRNPFTFGINNGGKIYVNDVGSNKYEEVNNIVKGGNYGWPVIEGPSTQPGLVSPIYAYHHNGAQAAITGGDFAGSQFPAQLQGKYFFTDYVNKWLRVIDPATNTLMTFNGSANFGTGLNGILDLDVGPDGALYGLAPYVGKIVRIAFTGAGSNQPPSAEASADKTGGVLPLTVNFSGDGSSDPNGDALTYAWNFGDGTTGAGKNVSHQYTTAGKFNATLTVSDGKGGTDTTTPIVITAGDAPPTATITLPASDELYDGGETINFAATGSDPEDGDLPASAFKWDIKLRHLDHEHPFLMLSGKTGSFTIPTNAEPDPRQMYRLYLTVTDSSGQSKTVIHDVQPHKSTISLASNIPGIVINVDVQPTPTGTLIEGVVNTVRQLNAPATQVVGGKTYKFVSWSDGGAAIHNINFPAANTTYTATYAQSTTTTQAVTSLTLVNANTDQDITTLANGGAVIDTAVVGNKLSIRANTSPTPVGSVVFRLDGRKIRTENYAKYHIAGENGTDILPWALPSAGAHTLVVTPYTGKDGTGTAGQALTVQFTLKTGSTPAPVSGLRATYFNNANFTGSTFSRIDKTVNFAFGSGSPNAAIAPDSFSARWTGKIKPAKTGTYRFYVQSDNGARLYVNNKLVVNDFTAHSLRERSGTIALTAGVKYSIRLEYFENSGSATIKLLWSGPSLAKQVVPATVLTTS